MKNATCTWTPEEGMENWTTDCGHYFTMIEGTPLENGMVFCCFCGAVIQEVEGEHDQW